VSAVIKQALAKVNHINRSFAQFHRQGRAAAEITVTATIGSLN
jgi:hypothetical protein